MKTPAIEPLTDGEERIMQMLWSLGEGTVNDILAVIPEPKPKYTTVATFIKILENKGYVAHRSEGKSYVFTPLVSREEVAGRQMQSMLRTYFDGSFAQMVTFFSKHENISMKEMDEILSVMQQIRKNADAMKELLIYALEVLVCSAALLLLAYSVLLERRTAFLHCRLYLIGAMLLAALIPALSIPVWTGETLYMAADPVAAAAPTAAPAATDAGTPSLPVAVTLFLYALGVLLSFGAMIAQIVRIRRLRHGARTIRRADCDIVLTQADISSFSFFRTVYLHDAIPESDMAAVVAHELSHIRHRHSAERIVMECVKALLWWNPFVRIAARRLAEVEEYEADRDVLTQGYDPSEYIATIFKTQFGYSPDIANGLRDSLTKNDSR